jgi:probable HAF family extracellular repeat protein
MKELATDRNGIAAAQHFKPMTPIRIYRERSSPMSRHNRRVIVSVAAGVMAVLAMASPVLAGPRPVTAHYAFTTVDFPDSTSTDLLGFTTGTMVGQFTDAEANTHGWLLSAPGGTFRQFDVAGAWSTSLSAINHSGTFGGVYRDDPEHPLRRHGFLVVDGVLTTIDYPGSTRTSIVQMNDRGQVVGIGRIPSEGATTPYGFVWKDGVFTDVSFPGAFGTGLDGINEQGDVCGFTTDEAGGLTHAMMRVKGIFSHVEPPGALDSIALSINDRGQVAGWYDDAGGNTHGFIYSGGVFTTIDVPGAPGSEVTTIDNNGVITGDYIGADGADHGFIGTPVIGTAQD